MKNRFCKFVFNFANLQNQQGIRFLSLLLHHHELQEKNDSDWVIMVSWSPVAVSLSLSVQLQQKTGKKSAPNFKEPLLAASK